MAIGGRSRRWLMWAAWTVLCTAGALYVGLVVGRPLYYSDGYTQLAGSELAQGGMVRWNTPAAERELPGAVTGRVAALPDGRLLYGVRTEDGTSDLMTWDPAHPDVPPEPAYGLNTEHNELAPAVGVDGRVWFASDRPASGGGYDLFVSQWSPRGFGRIEPVAACNTALDETDPAPDPRGNGLVFVRIDRRVRGGDDGVLWQWRSDDPHDPVRVFPELRRHREHVVDRDPAFAADGASLWFVRKRSPGTLAICRASRLGERFAAPATLSRDWRVANLRSPLPSPDGRAVTLLQPPLRGAPALLFVAIGEEVVPWWPGQAWLEWLLLSLAIGAGLLLLLLYLGQRWATLDLVAQCLLLSLLLHVLLFLWLMGVEIAGSLLPGEDSDDRGMQVNVVASNSPSSAATGGDGQVAASVRRAVAERAIAVAVPSTAAVRPAPARNGSLGVAHGDYDADPAPTATSSTQASLADAPATTPTKRGTDGRATPQPAALPAVEQK
ncbi:MAG TPA: hypothetical protein ENI87_00340, partial [bacterium]|nr:hypothetical protein [bacterium]